MSDVGSFFDAEAARYDAAYEDAGGAGRLLRERLDIAVELVGEGPGDVLDAGMGAGRLCAELERRGWTVWGIDLSPAMVAAARARVPDRAAQLVEGSIAAIPFADESFDVVAATGVLEYAVEDIPGAALGLARVLRPGGRAVVSFPNHSAPGNVWRGRVLYPVVRVVKKVVPVGRPSPPAVPLLPLSALESALAAAALEIEDVRPVGRSRRLARQIVYAARKRPR
jgi:SAM-dependent methyltransferase